MRTRVIQNNFLAGVLDPRARARAETETYSNGLLYGINITPHHLGGVRRRPGFLYRATLPNQLTRISTGITATAPNGGTANNAKDDTATTVVTTTTTVSTNDPYVVVHYDLGSAKSVLYADVVDMLSDGGSSTEFRIQYSADNVTFTDFGDAFESMDTTTRSYRRGGTAVSARYWRVAKVGGTDMGSVHIQLADFTLWQDSGTISEGRLFPWEISTSAQYVLALTDRSMSVFNGTTGALVASLPSPYTSADLAEIDATTNAETMIAVHEDYPPRAIVQELAGTFQTYPLVFDSVPNIDFNDSSSPSPTSDVQVLTFTSWTAGETFQLELQGAKTVVTTYAGDNATTAANIAREVQKLWTVRGFSGVSCARTGAGQFTLTFAGESADAYDLMSGIGISGSGTISVSHSVTGVARREPVWSATRGYPRTVAFFEGRLYFGGTRSRQQSLIGSQVNNILTFEIGEGLDDDPIFVTLNGAQLNAIQGLFAGRSLQIFTSGGEFRYVKEQGVPVTPGDAPVNQTQYGSARLRPVTIDGATLFVQRNAKSIRDYRFDYTENAYNSLGVSTLASHLVYDVKDIAAWNGSTSDEIGLVLVVNGTNPSTESDAIADGSIAVLNTRKEANVQAWTVWTTDGEFKAVSTVLTEIFVLVSRTLNGTAVLTLEQADSDAYTDCAKQVTNSPASATVTGLSHLNGEVCRVRADGFVLSNVTPSGGSATIDQASTDVEVGLDWTPTVTPMSLTSQTPGGFNMMRKRRIVKVRAMVRNTLGLLMNGRPLPDRFWDQDNFDEAASPFTGVHDIEESTNWDQTDTKLVSFTQTDPLPMEILGIDTEMESSE